MAPIIFGSAALGNVPQVIPEQRKLEICSEWFRNVASPVFVDVTCRDGDCQALEVLSRMLRKLDVASEEVVVHLTLDAHRIAEDWEKSRQLLGDDYRPKLVSVSEPDESAWRAVTERKASGALSGAGIVVGQVGGLNPFSPAADWIVLTSGFTIMRHSPQAHTSMTELSRRQIPIIVAGVFDGGFLLGDGHLDGRVLDSSEPRDRSLLAWRTSFAALCHGHGVAPAQACIQFALSGPGVVAVLLNSSHPDRVAQNVDFVERQVPEVFWASMREEGLLEPEHSSGGK